MWINLSISIKFSEILVFLDVSFGYFVYIVYKSFSKRKEKENKNFIPFFFNNFCFYFHCNWAKVVYLMFSDRITIITVAYCLIYYMIFELFPNARVINCNLIFLFLYFEILNYFWESKTVQYIFEIKMLVSINFLDQKYFIFHE